MYRLTALTATAQRARPYARVLWLLVALGAAALGIAAPSQIDWP